MSEPTDRSREPRGTTDASDSTERKDRENRVDAGASPQQAQAQDDVSKPQAEPTETPAGYRAGDSAQGAPASREPEAEVIGVRHGMFSAHGAGDTSGYGGLVRTVAMPPPATRPYGGYFDEVADVLAESLEGHGTAPQEAIEYVVVDRDELTLAVRREYLLAVVQRLRDEPDLRFELLSGVSGVHYPEAIGRELHAVYHLLSITHNRRVRLEVACPDADPHIPSVVSVYPTADWHERETWDFFGIVFDDHPALTRIEMPDDWPGHPQRKDYPLGGIPVEYKGASIPPPDTRRAYS